MDNPFVDLCAANARSTGVRAASRRADPMALRGAGRKPLPTGSRRYRVWWVECRHTTTRQNEPRRPCTQCGGNVRVEDRWKVQA
jgi:hypothetical protein